MATPAPVDTSSFTPAQLAAFNNAAKLSVGGVWNQQGNKEVFSSTTPSSSLPPASTPPVTTSSADTTSTATTLPGGFGAIPTMPSLDTLKAALGTLGTTPAQMGADSLQYQDEALAASQAIIDNIERSYNEQISTAAGGAAGASAAAGMAGSPQAAETVSAAMAPGIAARAGAVATAMENIRSLAASQYKDFQALGTTNAQNTVALFQDAQKQVVAAATSVWTSGHTPDELKQSNPDEYNYLLEYGYNGDPNAMNAAYAAAARGNLMNGGAPVYQNGNQTVYGQFDGVNPDGTAKLKFIPVTLPGSIPQGYKMQSSNQTTNGQVITTFAPVDSNGNIVYDESKPNGGIITQINGQTIGGASGNDGAMNPLLSGKTIGKVTLGIVPTGVPEAAAVAGQGIIDGTAPPTISGSMSGQANMVKAYLAANGFDMTRASLDWTAISKYVSTLNSATQLRFRQAVQSVPPMLDNAQSQFDKLQTDIQGTTTLPQGLRVLNSTNLALFASGAYGQTLQSDAITLQNQILDATSEIGVVFKGGNSATDLALQNGASMLSGAWDPETFKNAITLLKQNMQYRTNSVLNAGVAGSSDNTYAADVSGGTASDTVGGSTQTTYTAGTIVSDAQGNQYTVGADGETLTLIASPTPSS